MIRWADPEAIARAVGDFVEGLRATRPEVLKAYWYGSWVSGRPTPGSDVDLCVVVSHADRPPHDRMPDYLPERFPVGVDLVVLTEEELEGLRDRSPGWHQAITSGRAL